MKKFNKKIITKDTSISELLKISPKVVEILFDYGLMCAFCPRANEHDLESLKEIYGFENKDIDEILFKINKLIK